MSKPIKSSAFRAKKTDKESVRDEFIEDSADELAENYVEEHEHNNNHSDNEDNADEENDQSKDDDQFKDDDDSIDESKNNDMGESVGNADKQRKRKSSDKKTEKYYAFIVSRSLANLINAVRFPMSKLTYLHPTKDSRDSKKEKDADEKTEPRTEKVDPRNEWYLEQQEKLQDTNKFVLSSSQYFDIIKFIYTKLSIYMEKDLLECKSHILLINHFHRIYEEMGELMEHLPSFNSIFKDKDIRGYNIDFILNEDIPIDYAPSAYKNLIHLLFRMIRLQRHMVFTAVDKNGEEDSSEKIRDEITVEIHRKFQLLVKLSLPK